jgi:hypothetical protein
LLGSNNIGDAEAEVLAESVCSNNTLTTLALTNLQRYSDTLFHNSLTEIGWGAISKVLRESNHTLTSVMDPDEPEREIHLRRQCLSEPKFYDLQMTTNEIRHLVKINDNDNKIVVARQKGILFKHVIDIPFKAPLTEQMMLPRIISWVCRKSCDDIKFTSLFGLMAATPALPKIGTAYLQVVLPLFTFHPNEAKR